MLQKSKTVKNQILRIVVFSVVLISTAFHVPQALAYTHHTSLIRWEEYSPETFLKAEKEGKPIFLLVTAMWCHWCHVFEEKSLETQEVADYINKNFIPIFLDFDKRKDIAVGYRATGLPTTVIMAANGEKLVSVSGHIPKDELLESLGQTISYFKEEYTPLEEQTVEAEEKSVPLTEQALNSLIRAFTSQAKFTLDVTFGGFGSQTKKPNPEIWDWLLTYYEKTGEKQWLEMVVTTLDRMAGIKKKEYSHNRPDFDDLLKLYKEVQQDDWIMNVYNLQINDPLVGLYDPIDGGFFRYTTRRDWSVPHYEKILEDNAGLVKLYLHAYAITGDKRYKEVAEGALKYILTNLYDAEESRFYGSQDADDIYYHFTAEERKKVKVPRVDKTSYSRNNAQMALALFYASEVLKEKKYSEIAEKTLSFLKEKLVSTHGAMSYYDDKKKKGMLNGVLEDNALVALAFLEAYGYFNNKAYLKIAEDLIRFIFEKLHDPKGGGFYIRNSAAKEFYRPDELFSKEKPYRLNGITSNLLIRYAQITGNSRYVKEAARSLGLYIDKTEFKTSPHFQRVAWYLLRSDFIKGGGDVNGRQKN